MEKIVFVIPNMTGGGTERVVALLANEYCARGIPVTILLFAGNETAYPLDPRVEVVRVGGPTGGNPFLQAARLYRMRRFYRLNGDCQIWAFSAMGAVFSAAAAPGRRHFFSSPNATTLIGTSIGESGIFLIERPTSWCVRRRMRLRVFRMRSGKRAW